MVCRTVHEDSALRYLWIYVRNESSGILIPYRLYGLKVDHIHTVCCITGLRDAVAVICRKYKHIDGRPRLVCWVASRVSYCPSRVMQDTLNNLMSLSTLWAWHLLGIKDLMPVCVSQKNMDAHTHTYSNWPVYISYTRPCLYIQREEQLQIIKIIYAYGWGVVPDWVPI